MMKSMLENIEKSCLDKIMKSVEPYSEMSLNERYFLNGMIRSLKPQKVLEVGVSSGGGSAMILNAIDDIEGARLFSVDYLENAYLYPNKKSGFLVEEAFPRLMKKWTIYRGGDLSRFIDEIGGNIDLMVLDTAHLHPWETLNFLCALPFMKKEKSWVVLHDIALFYRRTQRKALACRYLWGHVVSEEKLTPCLDDIPFFANIGAFRITEDTVRYVSDLFQSLVLPWEIAVSDEDLASVDKIVQRHYPADLHQIFTDAVSFQKCLLPQRDVTGAFKEFIKQLSPGLYRFLKDIKSLFSKK